jgi:hypothetical protein
MEFRASIDCFGLERGCMCGIRVFQAIDSAIGVVLEAPCTAEIDDFDAMLDCLRNPFAGLLVGSC